MVVSTAGVRLAHVTLYVARENVANERILGASLVRPGIVLAGAQIDFVELVVALAAEQWVAELSCTVFTAKKQTKGMLGIAAASAECPAYPQARVKPESRRPVRMDQLDRRAPLPVYSIVTGVDIYAGGSVKKIRQIRYQRDCRYIEQSILHKAGPSGIVNDVRVHAVIDDLAVNTAGRPAGPRGLAVG